jgi:hypothetical protein
MREKARGKLKRQAAVRKVELFLTFRGVAGANEAPYSTGEVNELDVGLSDVRKARLSTGVPSHLAGLGSIQTRNSIVVPSRPGTTRSPVSRTAVPCFRHQLEIV